MILFILPSVRTVSKLSKKIRTATIASTSSVFTHTTFLCSTCTQQVMTKAGVRFGML